MEVRRHEMPVSHRSPPGPGPSTRRHLDAIAKVRSAWQAAGRDHVLQQHASGRLDYDPAFLEAVAAEHERAREAAKALPPEPVAAVAEVLRIKQRRENGRLVCRAIVRWDDGTIGEGIAWFAGTAQLNTAELVGLTARQLDRLLFERLIEQG